MLLIMTKNHNCKLEIIADSGTKINSHARFEDLSPLSMVIYRKTFFLVKAILDWISYMFMSNTCIHI